jgi:hypothetical protein
MKDKLLEFYFKNKNVILIALLGIAILLIGYNLFFKKKVAQVTQESNPEYYQDYSVAKIIERGDKLEDLGLKAEENYTVGEIAHVRRTQNFAQNNTIHELKFGTVIYTKIIDSTSSIKADPKLMEREIKKGYVAVYAEKPTRINDLPVGYMSEEEFVQKEKFKDYKPEIKEEEIIKYSATILDAVETNSDFDGTIYFLSENAKRSKEALAFGDYNNDGVKDMAVIVDDTSSSKSGILIFFKGVEGYKLAYKKGFASRVSLKTIKKETPIVLKVESTIFPSDGVYATEKSGNSYFHIYDNDVNEFMVIVKEAPIKEPDAAKSDPSKTKPAETKSNEPKPIEKNTPKDKPTDKTSDKKTDKSKP